MTIVTAAGVFIGTNIDDLIVLTVLMLARRAHGKPRMWQIWAGQYLGIGALVAVSVLAALGLTIVPDRWVGLLGMIPIALGTGPGSATRASMAKVIIGGQTLCLLLTLLMTPVAYSLFDEAANLKLWRWRRAARTAAATTKAKAGAEYPAASDLYVFDLSTHRSTRISTDRTSLNPL